MADLIRPLQVDGDVVSLSPELLHALKHALLADDEPSIDDGHEIEDVLVPAIDDPVDPGLRELRTKGRRRRQAMHDIAERAQADDEDLVQEEGAAIRSTAR